MFFEIWKKHKGKIIGCVGGVFLGIVYLAFGFWDMIVCLLLILIGYYIGRKIDSHEPWINIAKIKSWLSEIWWKIRR